MATHPTALGRFAAGPLQGVALALYFVLLPYVVRSKWALAAHLSDTGTVRALLVGLSIFWLAFLAQLVRNVLRLRRGLLVGGGGSAWLAGLVIAALPFLVATSSLGHPVAAQVTNAVVRADSVSLASSRLEPAPIAPRPSPHRSPLDLSSLSAVPLALMAKRRSDVLRDQQLELVTDQIDETITLLRASNPGHVERVRQAIGDRLEGVVRVGDEFNFAPLSTSTDAVVVCVLRDDRTGVVLSFAREGGRLRVPAHWSDADLIESTVALHDGGRLRFAHGEHELLRSLATRSLGNSLVVYLGDARELDDALRACSVTLDPAADDERLCGDVTALTPSTLAPTRRYDATVDTNGLEPGEVRVELLRAEPRVVGLAEPFTPTLRRRCVEMVA